MATRALVDALVTDRFPEFQKLAQDKGRLSTDPVKKGITSAIQATALGKMSGSSILSSDDSGPKKGAFMREFFEDIGAIQDLLKKGHENTALMKGLVSEALQATTSEKDQAVSSKLNTLVDETSDHVRDVKRSLEEVKSKCSEAEDQCSAAEIKVQANMQRAMIKKHQNLLTEFQKAQTNFKQALERRREQEMQVLLPDLSPEERRDMIAGGETTSVVVAKKMAGAHALLLDECERVLDKHKDILRLEQNIADLAQMFQEMAVLVDGQGEMLDSIQVHIHKAKDLTGRAEQELIKTRKYQHKNRKQLCCATAVAMIIVLVILGPIIMAQ
jgi:syntaxin 1B/2/3